MDKYLIVGLGNPGSEYAGTRHNAGYMVLDAFAKASNISFDDRRYGYLAETIIKGRKVFLLKPTTYMNLSGNAVRYWLTKENIDLSRLLVVSDEVALPLGQFRLKANGSNGGHNGLGHIQQLIGQQYARLRMGIGNDFPHGMQVQWVLGRFDDEELQALQPAINTAVEIIRSFVLAGINITMNQYNERGKGRKPVSPEKPEDPKYPENPEHPEYPENPGKPAKPQPTPFENLPEI
ncbi:MAG: aminoacyl-tRNA hydrolase [Prevotella sp.]|nr:aminoacyl-tRNA hydrolase [Prevotella sp.]